MKKIIIVRHGQTNANSEGKTQGQIDTDLNDIGLNNFPDNIISINTLTTVNLNNNMILSIPSNICELLENPCEIILTNNHPGLNCLEAPTCSNGETLTCD